MKSETPALKDAELDKVTGGSKIIQATHDMKKAIIANFRV
jgi:hypothetical protein